MEKQIRNLRIRLGKQIYKDLDGVVKRGPFQGMKLHPDLSWGQTSLAGKLLGTYEQGVVDHISRIIREFGTDVVINLGAADGYLAIGAGIDQSVKRLLCYEVNKESHPILKKNAALNGIAQKLEIYGKATFQSVSSLDLTNAKGALFVIDIEGAEYDLLTPTLLEHLSKSNLIIELHEATETKTEALKILLRKYYNIEEIKQDNQIKSIDFLKTYSDLERAMVHMEGRHYEGVWLICEPIEHEKTF